METTTLTFTESDLRFLINAVNFRVDALSDEMNPYCGSFASELIDCYQEIAYKLSNALQHFDYEER